MQGLLNRCATNADCRLADWQVNDQVNIVVICTNRFFIPETSLLGIWNLLGHFTTMFTPFTCQSESLQSVFVAHH